MDCCACVLLRVSVCDPPRGQYKPHRFFHSINSSIIFNLLYCQKVTLRLAPMRCEVMACQNVSNYIITHAVCANLPIPNLFLPLYSACEPLSTRGSSPYFMLVRLQLKIHLIHKRLQNHSVQFIIMLNVRYFVCVSG